MNELTKIAFELALEKLAATDPFRPSVIQHAIQGGKAGARNGMLSGLVAGALIGKRDTEGMSQPTKSIHNMDIAGSGAIIGGVLGIPTGAAVGGIKGYLRKRQYDKAMRQY